MRQNLKEDSLVSPPPFLKEHAFSPTIQCCLLTLLFTRLTHIPSFPTSATKDWKSNSAPSGAYLLEN